MKKEKWHKLHTWAVNVPYYNHLNELTIATIRLDSREGSIQREDAQAAVRRWATNLGIFLTSDEVATILKAGKHGFA